MRKVVILSVFALVAGGLFLAMPTPADAQCACVQRTNDQGTPADTSDDTCDTVCCTSGVPSEPPSEPPSEAPPVCGEICLTDGLTGDATNDVPQVDQAILIAGSDQSGQPAGCVALLGGTLHSNQATEQNPDSDYGACVAEAVAECEEGGCAETIDSTPGACS